ncbi:15852_t:CDS:2 [Gigaspora rosea]|nr:15852_t:CDS:2 [Gigaspora rosea]
MEKLEQFTCRADIFYASYCENEIETLQTRPIPILKDFAKIIEKNEIKYMREFVHQADVYFKSHLISLAREKEIKNDSVESDETEIQHKRNKAKN